MVQKGFCLVKVWGWGSGWSLQGMGSAGGCWVPVSRCCPYHTPVITPKTVTCHPTSGSLPRPGADWESHRGSVFLVLLEGV